MGLAQGNWAMPHVFILPFAVSAVLAVLMEGV
jgi:hypothetical protein